MNDFNKVGIQYKCFFEAELSCTPPAFALSGRLSFLEIGFLYKK